ncbi:FAM36A,Cox20/FAM36A [Cinara cedri]|uniref:Cytochrome c oxidase assembly protein COX20, mitochondrial n=1 Tax=Cinara cedri TaxID=506608 RepID=A0A5E4N0G9_9HEMI|nr:FAM36A,Cox20/FAM36A [Cinara cedri]
MASVSSDDEHKPVMLFGRDLSKIPCFRNSYLYGIIGGFAVGIGHFMFTSKVTKSTHIGFGSFIVLSSAYWSLCRYNHSYTEKQMNELKELISTKKSGINDIE